MVKRSTVLLLVVLSFGSWLVAQDNPPTPGNPPAQGEEPRHRGANGPPPVLGTITSVGVDRFDIKKSDGSSQTIMVNDDTRYRQRVEGQDQPQELSLENLKVGDHVFVRGTPNGNQFTAMGVNRVTAQQLERFQNGGGPGGPGGGMGPGGGAEGTRAGGEIESIKGNEITVNSRRFGEKVIVVNDQTTVQKEGQTIGLKNLKVGDRIFAVGSESNGKFVATEIHSGRPHGEGGGGWQRPQGDGRDGQRFLTVASKFEIEIRREISFRFVAPIKFWFNLRVRPADRRYEEVWVRGPAPRAPHANIGRFKSGSEPEFSAG
jgi:hypothetical protein